MTTMTKNNNNNNNNNHNNNEGKLTITDPNENDVLCGRGKRINNHAGNVQFRNMIHSKKKDYVTPSTPRREKAHIAAGIVHAICTMHPPGRFLMMVDTATDTDGRWFDIGDAKALKKSKQALREDAPIVRTVIDGSVSSGDFRNRGRKTALTTATTTTTSTTTTKTTATYTDTTNNGTASSPTTIIVATSSAADANAMSETGQFVPSSSSAKNIDGNAIAAVASKRSLSKYDMHCISLSTHPSGTILDHDTTTDDPNNGLGKATSSVSLNDGFVVPAETISVKKCDVLLGRGQNTTREQHTGNLRCAAWVKKQCQEYETGTKGLQTEITQQIVNKVFESGGRFLKQDKQKIWKEVSGTMAMEKIAHFFRRLRAPTTTNVSHSIDHASTTTPKLHDSSHRAVTNSRSPQPAAVTATATAAIVDEYSITDDALVGPNDVICGRGSGNYTNCGNRRFHVLIEVNVETYNNIESKHKKGIFILSLIHTITQKRGGKFFKVTKNNNNTFTELTELQSRAKVGHAFRDYSVSFDKKSQRKQQRQQKKKKKKQPQHYVGDGSRNDTNKDTVSVPKQTRQQQQQRLRRPSLISQQQQLLPQLSTSILPPPRVLRFTRTSRKDGTVVQQVLLVPRDIGDNKTVHDAMVVAQQRTPVLFVDDGTADIAFRYSYNGIELQLGYMADSKHTILRDLFDLTEQGTPLELKYSSSGNEKTSLQLR